MRVRAPGRGQERPGGLRAGGWAHRLPWPSTAGRTSGSAQEWVGNGAPTHPAPLSPVQPVQPVSSRVAATWARFFAGFPCFRHSFSSDSLNS